MFAQRTGGGVGRPSPRAAPALDTSASPLSPSTGAQGSIAAQKRFLQVEKDRQAGAGAGARPSPDGKFLRAISLFFGPTNHFCVRFYCT